MLFNSNILVHINAVNTGLYITVSHMDDGLAFCVPPLNLRDEITRDL